MNAAPHSDALAFAYVHCETIVREHDNDRWRASLFAPEAARPSLHALYAFSHEIAVARGREPMAGEIRHQWWRDALGGAARGDAEANPVAAAIFDVIARFHLPIKAFTNLIDARTFDLYDDLMPSLVELEGYCGETSSALFRLASIIVANGDDPGGADAAGHAGVAYALTGLMRALPWQARQGQVYLPRDLLDRHGVTREDIVAGRSSPGLIMALRDLRAVARMHLENAKALSPSLDQRARAAFLPLALTPYYLDRLDRVSDPLNATVDLSPIRKMWTLWRATRA